VFLRYGNYYTKARVGMHSGHPNTFRSCKLLSMADTMEAKLANWDSRAALFPFDRGIDPNFLGYPLRAFVLTRVKQRLLSEVTAAFKEVPEVIEAQGLSGIAGLLIQVVARDADDLYRIAGQILAIKVVRRTSTALVMRELVDFGLAELILALRPPRNRPAIR
jgi:hypothetical protein